MDVLLLQCLLAGSLESTQLLLQVLPARLLRRLQGMVYY